MNRLVQLLPIALLSACGGLGNVFQEPPPTLADLQPASLPAHSEPVPQPSLAEMAQIYRDVLAGQQDEATRVKVAHRLADIEMLDAEEQLALSDSGQPLFTGAIDAYEQLLADNPDYPLKDQLLYQLSKAYALSGESDASQIALERLGNANPDSPHLPEAYFRQAERQFVNARYANAEGLYSQVVAYGQDTPYYTRALYMQGWSRFKQDKLSAAVEAFTASLDQLIVSDTPIDTLPRGEQELVQDSLRVLAIVFSKQQGVESIASAYQGKEPRPYEYLLYESLGGLYLSQERYNDSARTYQAFIERHPDSRRAHRFHMRVIEAYEAGEFDELIISARESYVQAYSVDSSYWQDSTADARETMARQLQLFIPELASHYHAMAQANAGKDASGAQVHYQQAAHYYQLFLDSFPNDAEVPRLAFLLAESLYEAQDYFAAIAAYEWVAYIQGDPDNAADAAYTAILAYEKLIDGSSANSASDNTEEGKTNLRRSLINSELRFAQSFAGDSRANSVLGHAASALFELQDYPAALAASTTLLSLTPAAAPALRTPAWLVAGHSQFALHRFADAEQAYQQSLALLANDDPRRPATTDRLAAAIYKQGEQATVLGEDALAAGHFQRASAAAPNSKIGINAQFDAAQALTRAGELEHANLLLTDFRQHYPQHELSVGIGAALLQNYEQLQQWKAAALELDRMHANTDAQDLARQTLIVAARYYDKAGDHDTAIARYRSYAHNWPTPLHENLEAINRLGELYAAAGDTQKQHYWLRKAMAAHDNAGDRQSDRSRYLAANAASILANASFDNFAAIKLTLPINKTLPRKKRAMEETLGAYNRCNDYAVEQFITQCTYRVGQVYQQLSADLMDSQRPAGLDALALEQYDIMLEEQAFPFEEKAIAIHETNAARSRKGVYDEWVRHSFVALGELLPARYAKLESADAAQLAGSIEQPPRKVQEYNRDGIALREMGDFNAAEEAYLAALDTREDDALTHRNIGILYDLYLGIPGKAMYHYNRYQSLTEDTDRRVAGWIVDLERRHVRLARESL